MKVLVTGGRGSFGRLLVPRLQAAGHQVEITSRSGAPGPDGTPTRVLDLTEPVKDDSVTGVDAIVHAASNPARSRAVDITGTASLVEAAHRAQVPHLLYISIVGIDEHPFPYYRSKIAAEERIAQHDGHTILRATQFHEFLDRIFSTGPVVTVFRGMEFQVIDGGVVADRMVELVGAGPQGRVPDLGGPRSETMKHMATTWKTASGSRKPTLPIPALGKAARAFKAKMHHTPNRADGTPTWDDWLAQRYESG